MFSPGYLGPMVVFGIDPGATVTGWGVVAQSRGRFSLVDCGCVKTSSKTPIPERLLAIHAGLLEALSRHEVDGVAIEAIFRHKSSESALRLGQARGVALLAGVLLGAGLYALAGAVETDREAVRRFRAADPEGFDLLTRLPITTQRYDRASNSNGQARWFVNRQPVIKLDSDGEVSGLRLNERQIAPLDVPHEEIGPAYKALRRLFDFVYDPDLRLTFPLKAGEGLIFDNHRVLHGRTGFTPSDPPRRVLTSSVDLEEFHSSLRMLELRLGLDRPRMGYTQGLTV